MKYPFEPVAVCCAGTLLLASGAALAQGASSPLGAEAAALVLVAEPSASSLPLDEIGRALEASLGRPILEQPGPELAQITLSVDANDRVVIRYQPPPGELERSVSLRSSTGSVASLVAIIAKELVYRDAGIELPVQSKAAQPAASAPETTPRNPAPEIAEPAAPAPAPRPRPGKLALTALARAGAFGQVTTGGSSGGVDATFGGALRLDLPVIGRFALGAELGILSFETGLLPGDGDLYSEVHAATYVDLSVVPSVRLTTAGASTEVRLAGAFGLTLPIELTGDNLDGGVEGMPDDVTRGYSGEAGYRAALFLNGTYWLDSRWGVHAAIGVEHHFTISTRAELSPTGVERSTAKLWLTEPVLQLGASLRF